MKVLQINTYATGSTGKIVVQLHEMLLRNGFESIVMYGRGNCFHDDFLRCAKPIEVKAQSLLSRVSGVPYGGCPLSTNRVLRTIDEIKPDVVHLHCLNGYFINVYKLLNYLKKTGVRTILTLHAEFMYTGGCTHTLGCEKWKSGCSNCPQIRNGTHPRSWFFDNTKYEWESMRSSFEGFDNLVICPVSDWVRMNAERSPFFNNGVKISTVNNGVDTSIYHPKDAFALQEMYGKPEKKIILHVTPEFSHPLKGGNRVIELAEMFQERFDDVLFLVIGKADAIEKYPDNIVFVGEISNENKLADYYSIADVTLLTSVRETYSMVTVESLCCGTPVVGFRSGGPESIALRDYSLFFDQADLNGVFGGLIEIMYGTYPKEACAEKASKLYSAEVMAAQYEKLYRDE